MPAPPYVPQSPQPPGRCISLAAWHHRVAARAAAHSWWRRQLRCGSRACSWTPGGHCASTASPRPCTLSFLTPRTCSAAPAARRLHPHSPVRDACRETKILQKFWPSYLSLQECASNIRETPSFIAHWLSLFMLKRSLYGALSGTNFSLWITSMSTCNVLSILEFLETRHTFY